MAYPFGWNPPSIGKVIDECKKHGCKVCEPDGKIFVNSREIQPRILTRDIEGGRLHVAIPEGEDDVLLTLFIVDQMCRRLQIDSSVFGFKLNPDNGEIIEVN